MTTCCTPKRLPGPSGWTLRHTRGCAKVGQPFEGERHVTNTLSLAHRIETAATGLELHPVLQGSSVREHFDRCTKPNCDLCDYVTAHLDDEDESSAVSW